MLLKLKSLGKNTMIYGIGSSLQKFISLLLLPFFTHYINPEGYGVLAMVGIITMIITPIFSLGLGASIGISYFKSRSKKKRNATIWTAFFILLASVLLASILLLLFNDIILKVILLENQYKNILYVGIIGSLFSILNIPFLLKLQFNEKAKLYVMINLTSTFITAILSIIMIIYLDYGIYGIIVPQLIGNIFIFTFLLFTTFKDTIIVYSTKVQKELLKHGIPLIPSFAFLFILMHSNKYILQYFGELETLGIYSVGFSLGSVISIVTNAIATAWFPFFMSYINKQKESEIIFGKIFTYYIYGVGFITLLFFIFAKPIVILLLNEKFYESYKVIGMVAMSYYLLGIFNMFLPGIYFSKRVKKVSILQFYSAILSLPFTYFYVSYFNLLGMGYSLITNHLLLAIITYKYIINNNLIDIKYEWSRLIFYSIFFIFNVLIINIQTNYEITKLILILFIQALFTSYLFKKVQGVRNI